MLAGDFFCWRFRVRANWLPERGRFCGHYVPFVLSICVLNLRGDFPNIPAIASRIALWGAAFLWLHYARHGRQPDFSSRRIRTR